MNRKHVIGAILVVLGLLLGGVGVAYHAGWHESDLSGTGPTYDIDSRYLWENETLLLEIESILGQETYPATEVWVGVKPATMPLNELNTNRATLRGNNKTSRNGSWVGDGGIYKLPPATNDSVLVTGDNTDRDGDGNAGIEEGDMVVVAVEFYDRDRGENRTAVVRGVTPRL